MFDGQKKKLIVKIIFLKKSNNLNNYFTVNILNTTLC